ncbi:hypothetical protein ACLM5J_10980 [Nocardioides sp. Bht2]|uniref:hypothetical protein n=1 Tax=Nocardioides sp. Bht2 TaxID=3392297 RepID=UPI0039B5C6B7
MSHRYLRVGVVRPRVVVSYGARFRVEGGRWRAVEGVVPMAGQPVRVEVVEAEPVLVAPGR